MATADLFSLPDVLALEEKSPETRLPLNLDTGSAPGNDGRLLCVKRE
jgi:hypothetical protein